MRFFLVNLYGRTTPYLFLSQVRKIKGLISSIKFPDFNFNKFLNYQVEEHKLDSNQKKEITKEISFTLPTVSITSSSFYNKPDFPPSDIFLLTPTPTSFLFNFPSSYIFPTIQITSFKPTQPPKPTATPTFSPITSDMRPGTSLTEIFKEVNKRACIPVALLYAFKTVETGERFKNDSPSVIRIYNTYGWWITGAGDPCYGFGYHAQTGIVPEDSVKAGTRCENPIGDPNDLKIMGILQISEWEQQVVQKYISSIIPKNDRRVLFDNALIFAYLTRNRVGKPPKDCDNWPDEVIKIAASKHLGNGCEYYYSQTGASGNYCNEVLTKYKEYKKQGF